VSRLSGVAKVTSPVMLFREKMVLLLSVKQTKKNEIIAGAVTL
jgi:hypothetical protein